MPHEPIAPDKSQISTDQEPISNDKQEYYMGIALAVRERANCTGRKVGAVIVLENRIISTGYNGTPEGMTNCMDGGCLRCRRDDLFKPGHGYDVCICVHAEQNALLSAARFGIAVQGAAMFTTLTPCFGCAKELIQAGVRQVYYLHHWSPDDHDRKEQHEKLLAEMAVCTQVRRDDPRSDWANKRAVLPAATHEAIDEHGHESL